MHSPFPVASRFSCCVFVLGDRFAAAIAPIDPSWKTFSAHRPITTTNGQSGLGYIDANICPRNGTFTPVSLTPPSHA